MVLAVAVLVHALVTRGRPNPAIALALDISLVFLTLELLGVPTAVMAIAYITYGVIATLLCQAAPRILLAVLASALLAGAAFWDPAGNPTSFTLTQIAGWTASAILLALLLGIVAMTVDLLQRQVEDVDRANQQLQALARSKDDLIATVSHEIRTPLAAVLGFSSELHDAWEHFDPVDGRELAHLIAGESRTIAHIVDDLVVAARADLGSLAVRLEPVRVHAEIRAFLDECTQLQHPIHIIGQDVEVETDPPRFRQILRHLLSNAVIHGSERIWVETAPGPGLGFVRVCDNGGGIPEGKREAVFAPFVRGYDKATQPESFGLGLTVARRLADAMGGSMTYSRKAGTSIFELTLRQTHADKPSSVWTPQPPDSPTGDRRRPNADNRPAAT
ncbi:MAG TPA: HAMP domain-containing sensor histidine kinase [Acidimicrobiia bacterium]|nr:HAMP domain-containing sensor histidine kinase [Acidimicrobiia bacterium]